jgi:glycosyltransferase involved in cell wall biosynthesis
VEIVVVDDGSLDSTAARAAALGRRHPVRVVSHGRNRGYGAAVRSGIQASRMPWILLTDADLQFDLAELDRFAALTAGSDLVVGRRVDRADSVYRRVGARAWNGLVRSMFRLPLRDVDCAFKLMRADTVQRLDLVSDGATLSAELILKALAAGARVEEIDVSHRPRLAGRQSGGRASVVVRALRELAALRRATA